MKVVSAWQWLASPLNSNNFLFWKYNLVDFLLYFVNFNKDWIKYVAMKMFYKVTYISKLFFPRTSWVEKVWAKNIAIIDCRTGLLLDTLSESPLLASHLHYKMLDQIKFYEKCWYMLLACFQLKRKKKIHLHTSLRIKVVASLWYTSLLSCIDASKHMHHHFCPLVTRCTVFQQNFIPAIRSLLCNSVI